MAEPLVITTRWPARILHPNASHTRDFWTRSRAKSDAKNEAFAATCKALGGWRVGQRLTDQFGVGPDRIKVTIHAYPRVNRSRDDDGLIANCKAHLDGIAKRLKVNDKRFELQPVQWHPAGGPGQVQFEVEVAP